MQQNMKIIHVIIEKAKKVYAFAKIIGDSKETLKKGVYQYSPYYSLSIIKETRV